MKVETLLISRSTSSCFVGCCVKSELTRSKQWYSKLPSQLGPWDMGKTKRQPCVTTVQPFPGQPGSVLPAYQSSNLFHHSLTYLCTLPKGYIDFIFINQGEKHTDRQPWAVWEMRQKDIQFVLQCLIKKKKIPLKYTAWSLTQTAFIIWLLKIHCLPTERDSAVRRDAAGLGYARYRWNSPCAGIG